MLTREVSRIMPGGHRQSLDDDARGGLRRFAPTLTPPRRVIICDAPGASLRDASITSLRDLRSHRFAMLAMLRSLRDLGSHSCKVTVTLLFCAARCSMPQKVSEIPTLLGPLRAGALQVPSKSRANRFGQ